MISSGRAPVLSVGWGETLSCPESYRFKAGFLLPYVVHSKEEYPNISRELC